jgi:hypothetical protein
MNLCKIKIDFELVSVDGHVHSPVFTICAKCDTIVGKLIFIILTMLISNWNELF